MVFIEFYNFETQSGYVSGGLCEWFMVDQIIRPKVEPLGRSGFPV